MVRKRAIHQILSHFAYGDAIGHDTLNIQARLRDMGYESEIFASHIHFNLLDKAYRPSQYADFSNADNILIWHFSIGTSLANDIANLPDTVIMRYHNITPDKYFAGLSSRAQMECRLGRRQLAQAAGFVDLAIGDSAYNRTELDEMGYKQTADCPIILDLAGTKSKELSPGLAHLKDKPFVLHVGRLVPQKRYDDILKSFWYLERINPDVRLVMTGKIKEKDAYFRTLVQLKDKLGLERVDFTGFVSDEEIKSLFATASAYICLSDHEGFCVPLVEAMASDLPVVAKNATAVPETMGASGVILDNPSHSLTAEIMQQVLTDQVLRQDIIQAQQERRKYFSLENTWKRFWSILQPLAEA